MTNAAMAIQNAQEIMKKDHQRGLALLNDIFRNGRLPEQPLNGRTKGEMVGVNIAPILTPFVEKLLRRKMPWVGKVFNTETAKGENIFWRSSLRVFRFLFPFYRNYHHDNTDTVLAFTFRTYHGKGREDSDREVLKIDYNDKSNPGMISRILDELVQVDNNLFLGKAHMRWWWGKWQLVFYFTLEVTK